MGSPHPLAAPANHRYTILMPKKIPKTKVKKQKKVLRPANPQPVTVASAVPYDDDKGPKLRADRPKFAKPVHPKAKITFRHNILPPLLGILMFAGILGLLNAQWLIAQYRYRFAQAIPGSAVSTPTGTVDPQAAPRIIIPKINVTAPVITDEKSYANDKVQVALRRGVVQYGSASADPGQIGNMVIVGHSSGQLWAPGDYKFVFTLLEKLGINDRIFVDFKGKRYIYRVSATKVVPPTDLTVLRPTDEPVLTLITCTPVGTSRDRLVITAKQISPDPKTAAPAKQDTTVPVSASAIPN